MEYNKDYRLLKLIKSAIARRFDLHVDKADEQDVVLSIKKNSDFIGANLWTLIFAIFIASIGLNVNSTAVIIGAMLISPLMGPIMGIGLGIGINDFELVKKGIRNLLIATLISIATSTFYFWITPLHDAQSELLARTTPSVWDVFIAFFGGLAGIVAGTRKEKSNVIPGVAIATALMPPLCTAGFGLASGHFYYFLGAIYLYFINSVFICISTFLIVRFLKFRKKRFEDKAYEKKVSRYIFIIILVTVAPSVYLAYGIVQKSIFATNAQKFISEQFKFKNTQVVNKTVAYDARGGEIDLLLIGYELPNTTIDSLRSKMGQYNLHNTKLNIRQGLNAKQEIDFSQIKASILEDVFKKDSSARIAADQKVPVLSKTFPDISQEIKALYPYFNYYAVANTVIHRADTTATDTVTLALVKFSQPMSVSEATKLRTWLKSRLNADSVQLVIQ
ncbi:TIGR00341 family protein [Arachidicoccus rhizosphaerae]|uniref:TIGR00341 family protein n=1 Tax=Arachidicoccus rhizosphaerae TaxID=551991 RepID=A0A1H4CVQ0_9BACT|nr:TIGR00341 family protein [Arachidicoccus rhizosphaerae]SEA64192.1 TIGR00341 family protein [Arachidicoccus rhizosphaerae]